MTSDKNETAQIATANNNLVQNIAPQATIAVSSTNNLQEDKPSTKPKFFRISKISFFLIATFLIFLSSTIILGAQYIMTTPQSVLTSALDKFSRANRLVFHVSIPEHDNSGSISLDMDFQKNHDNLSTAKFKIDKVDNDPTLSYGATVLFSKKDLYILPTVSKIDELEKRLNAAMPGLSSMRSYQMLQPVLKSESYLHIDLSPYATTSAILEKKIASDEQIKELTKRFFLSLKVRSFDHNYSENSSSYYKIVAGFKKKEFEDFVNYFKELNLDVKVSDINQLIRIINSVQNWDDDLFTFLINKKTGELNSLTVYLPYISPEALNNTSLEAKTTEATSSAINALIPATFGDLLKNNNVGKKQYIGKLEFTDYKDGPGASVPVDTVEFTKVMQAIQDEIINQGISKLSENSMRLFDTNAIETKRLWEKGLYEQSLQQAKNLLQIAENDVDKAVAHYWIGLSYYMMQKYAYAENEELQAIQLAPTYGAPYSTLSALTLLKGESQKAYEFAQKAVALSPNYAWAHNSLGLSLIALGKREEGIAELRKAVSLQPDSFVFQDNLTRALGNNSGSNLNINSANPSPTSGISSSSSNFHSEGQRTLEDGLTATINSATKINNTIQIQITFANTSSSPKTVVLARIQMKSPSQSTSNKENYGLDTLNAMEVRQESLTYDLLSGSPLSWYYLSTSGNDITLGSYIP